jgi:hypothetical protein
MEEVDEFIATNDNMKQYYLYAVILQAPSTTTLTLIVSLATVTMILIKLKIKKRATPDPFSTQITITLTRLTEHSCKNVKKQQRLSDPV